MPYIPPHKRRSTDPNLPPSSPNVTQPPQPQPTNRRRPSQPGSRLVYAPGATSIWWPVSSSAGDDRIPSSFHLEPVPGTKELVLAGDPTTGDDERTWLTIVERIQAPLLASMQKAIEDSDEVEEIKLSFLARIGKVRFKEGVCLDSIKMAAASEGDGWNKVHKSFYTHVSNTYMEDMENIIVPKIGLSFESAKEYYHVKVFDNSRPDITISCKCIVVGDRKELELYKYILERPTISNEKIVDTPLQSNVKLRLIDGEPLPDPTRYTLSWSNCVFLALTSLMRCHAVRIVSRFISALISLCCSLWIQRYLYGTVTCSRFFSTKSELGIYAYSDAD